MTVRRLALQASLALDHKRAWHHAAKHFQDELHVGPLWFWRRGANAAKKPTNALWHPGVVISNTLATVWIAYRGSVVKCARSQVRPFHEDDEAAGETQAITKLKKRFAFGHWEVGKGKFCSRKVAQAANGSMRVGKSAYIKSLDFVPLGKLRKEQSGDADEVEQMP